MLSPRKDKKFQKQPKDGILGLETYPPGAISVIFLHTAAFSYWLLSIPFSLVLDLECMVFPGFVNCTSKVVNLRSCSPSLFADQQVQRIPRPPCNWDPQNTQILGLSVGECFAFKDNSASEIILGNKYQDRQISQIHHLPSGQHRQPRESGWQCPGNPGIRLY